MAYEFVLPPLTLSERGQYYAESKRMAALFGISAEALPKDWTGFLQYTAKMFDSPQLCVDAGALALGRSVMSGAGTWLRPPHWYGALTVILDAAATPHGVCIAIRLRARKRPCAGPGAGCLGFILLFPARCATSAHFTRPTRGCVAVPPDSSRARATLSGWASRVG